MPILDDNFTHWGQLQPKRLQPSYIIHFMDGTRAAFPGDYTDVDALKTWEREQTQVHGRVVVGGVGLYG